MSRVLIVEDDPAQARTLARAFAKFRPDLTILTSHNGVEAKRLIGEHAVDLVLTDLQMPEMDGFELVAWVLNHSPGVPVFTMSGFASQEAAARLNLLGPVEYFKKPIDVKAMLNRVIDTLSQSVRGHVHNVSLASFLQLMEMERKSCSLTIDCDDRSGVLMIRKGELVDAQVGALRGEEAAIAIIAWPSPSIAIAGHNEIAPRVIDKPLGFIVMEAMRVQDENARLLPPAEPGSDWPAARSSHWPSAALSESGLPGPGAAFGLPSGASYLAIVDTATGTVLREVSRDGSLIGELALSAAQVLRQETATLELCDHDEGIEELVVSTSSRCDVIQPLSSSEFALAVFAPDDTNLVMARLELRRFIASRG